MSACDAAGMSDFALSEAEFRALYQRLRRAYAWGPGDRLDLDALAELCEARHRSSFLCVVAPLRLREGTGSPVNPIAIF
jgi:hypothetical protein